MTQRWTQTLGRRALAEGVGTFFLVLIGTGAIMSDAWSAGSGGVVGVALAFAFVITCMVYAIGHLSGAHINPAVTIAFWSTGRFSARNAAAYVVAQCCGAIAASLILWEVLGPVAGLGATVPALGIRESFVVEWLLSFALMFVITAVATDERVVSGFAGLAVGLTVGFDVLAAWPLTGASMNPARSLGPAVVGGIWDGHWIYWVAPILGMIAASWSYEALRLARTPPHARGGAEVAGDRRRRRSGRGRRSGADRRRKDHGLPEGVEDRRSGDERREGRRRR